MGSKLHGTRGVELIKVWEFRVLGLGFCASGPENSRLKPANELEEQSIVYNLRSPNSKRYKELIFKHKTRLPYERRGRIHVFVTWSSCKAQDLIRSPRNSKLQTATPKTETPNRKV